MFNSGARRLHLDSDRYQLLDMLHDRGADFVAMLELYLDESGTHADSPIMCVAGYLFTKGSRRKIEKVWDDKMKKAGVGDKPFHMKELCSHRLLPRRKGETDQSLKDRHDKLIKSLIPSLGRCAKYGVGVYVVEHSDFDRHIGSHWKQRFGGLYTISSLLCLARLVQWCDENSFYGKISYVFEAGHREQAFLDAVLRGITQSENLKKGLRYKSHAFEDKGAYRALQAADLIAYELQKLEKRNHGYESRPPRKSVKAMPHGKTSILNVTPYLPRIVSATSGCRGWSDEGLLTKLIPRQHFLIEG